MKVIGLISGGKDSIYNLMQCQKNGHEIVMLGHLSRPKDKGELDSYMYQTVGSEMADAIAECLGLPLIKREISSKPINFELEYKETKNDEVEDLFLLLQDALKLNPEIKGVSSGAIMSTYQKNRVENLCDRLGLTSIAYLWERNQKELLKEMIDNEMNSVIIKTCAYGLGKDDLLKSIKDLYPKLLDLSKQFDLNICGEGGEFESLTLDCPLYKKKIEITEFEKVIHSSDAFTEVSYAVIKKWEVKEK